MTYQPSNSCDPITVAARRQWARESNPYYQHLDAEKEATYTILSDADRLVRAEELRGELMAALRECEVRIGDLRDVVG